MVPFEEALCANGESTGIGVNFTSQSKEVVIFLMGGGACWDGFTCYIANIATHVSSGYDEKKFSGDKNGFLSDTLMFNRTLSDNPFRDANYVYVPYCTGDVHAGNNVPTYSGKKTHHVGAVNMEAYLQRIVATFPDAERHCLAAVLVVSVRECIGGAPRRCSARTCPCS